MSYLVRYGRGYASKLRVIASSFSNTENDAPYVLQTDRKPIIFYNEGPVITSHPVSQTLPMGSDATFTVTATGTAPLSYQWKHGLSDISGATSNTYVANGFDGTKTTYMVVVSNITGSVGSIPAVLKVS